MIPGRLAAMITPAEIGSDYLIKLDMPMASTESASAGWFYNIPILSYCFPSLGNEQPALEEGRQTPLGFCPVCSKSLNQARPIEAQLHLERCLRNAEKNGRITGDRYSVHTWTEKSKSRECTICFEEFEHDQPIAVLNCLCQYHRQCIDQWFSRGKQCPFHSPHDK